MSNCKKDGARLTELWAKSGGSLTPTYLRWCDRCNTIYILKPEELIPEEMLIPFLAVISNFKQFEQLPQMEVL